MIFRRNFSYLEDTNYHTMNHFQDQNSISHFQGYFIIDTQICLQHIQIFDISEKCNIIAMKDCSILQSKENRVLY